MIHYCQGWNDAGRWIHAEWAEPVSDSEARQDLRYGGLLGSGERVTITVVDPSGVRVVTA